MNQDYQACKTVGIYVPSYKRSDRIMTWNVLNDCTYVVRESEEAAYRKAGITKILTAPDEEINSLAKVRQWIIDNTPEDIVIQCDDDISRMIYKGKNNKVEIADKDVIDMEFERVAQILSDLRLGFASCTMTGDVRKFNAEFLFKGITGGICWFNKECLILFSRNCCRIGLSSFRITSVCRMSTTRTPAAIMRIRTPGR